MTDREGLITRAARLAGALITESTFGWMLLTAGMLAVITTIIAPAGNSPPLDHALHDPLFYVILAVVTAIVTFAGIGGSIWNAKAQVARDAKLADAEKAATENPEKPQLAWVVGQAKLEKYLDRNLAQVRAIAALTYLVMLAGFGLILYGLLRAFDDPSRLPVAIVASASGVLVSFIGGSFLLVYRALLAQSREYLFVLERINGVGMAVSVLESIPDVDASLRHRTTAELSKNLLTLYGATSTAKRAGKRKSPA